MTVLCVDDNPAVADAIMLKLSRTHGYTWKGWLPTADDLVATAQRDCPDVVLLDLDMPGRDPLEAAAELGTKCPDSRVVVFTGHVRAELIERAFEAGAWGYVSKGDGEDELVAALERVSKQQVALSPEARSSYNRL
jgi:DNA-binding NarL/FixJ family response regulator